MACDQKPVFTWDDTVKVRLSAPPNLRPGNLASVVGISLQPERKGEYLRQFPYGVVYTIEFEDGSDAQIEEGLVERGAFPSENHSR